LAHNHVGAGVNAGRQRFPAGRDHQCPGPGGTPSPVGQQEWARDQSG